MKGERSGAKRSAMDEGMALRTLLVMEAMATGLLIAGWVEGNEMLRTCCI
jgi:hypothetical protein